MTTYHSYGVTLSPGQKEKLARAYQTNSAITIRLSSGELTGSDELILTKRQIAKLIKAKRSGKGADIKISKTQIRSAVAYGGSLWGSLFSLGTKLLPYASKAVPALATGALSALGSLGVDRLFRKKQSRGFLVPQSKIDQLIKYKTLLTKKQKEDIVNALQSGGQLVIKPTLTQSGGFLGSLLASIGIPLVMKALTGRGLQVESRRPRRSIPVYVPKTRTSTTSSTTKKEGGKHMPYPFYPPPFIGNWSDYGPQIGRGHCKKKKTFETNHFVNKALSNYDLKDWVKQLGIKYFRGVYSRDTLPDQIKR